MIDPYRTGDKRCYGFTDLFSGHPLALDEKEFLSDLREDSKRFVTSSRNNSQQTIERF
jgi:hypothetical protein